jgi:hypothetical protein
MKKLLFFAILLFSVCIYSQAPQGISYQAVAFNTSGNPIVNGTVGVKISILDNSISGTVVYAETHTKSTNSQGLFNLNIGQGTPLSGTFPAINWGANSKFLKVEVDPNGGANYTTVGTTQLMSVPYALYAEKIDYSNIPQTIRAKSNTSEIIVIYTNTNAYGFYQSGGAAGYWQSISLSGTPIGAIASDNNIVVYTTTNGYGFYQNNGGAGYWQSISFGGTPISAVASNKNIVVYTDTNAYGFYQNGGATGYWQSISLNGSPIGAVASNDNAVVYTTTNAYGFYQNDDASGYWQSISLSGSPIGAIASKNNILVYTDTNAYGFYQNAGASGYWQSQSLSGTPLGAITK